MTAQNYEIGISSAATGTATTTGAAVAGSSTAFLTEFAVGYLIKLSTQYRVVSAIADNNNLTVSAAFSPNVNGQAITRVNLVNLADLSTAVMFPKSTFLPWQQAIPLGSGKSRGAGKPSTKWHFDFLPLAQRTVLRTFCSGKSSDVYIRTLVNDADAFKHFSAVMLWPDTEDKTAGRRLNIDFEFKFLVEITTS